MTNPKSELTRERTRSAWLFLAPTLVVLALVAGWPLGRTIWFSFTDASLDSIGDSTYKLVGLSNYFGEYGVFNFAAPEGFWQTDWGMAIQNTFKFSLVSVVLETVLGVVFALVLNAEFKGRALVRAAVLVPWAIPTIVSAKMWAWIMHDQFGVLNAMLRSAGIIDHNIAWTADPAYALWSVVLVDVWKTTPFMALLTLAALQMLPRDCYEAAHVDGIHPVKVFFKVTLPLIWPALMVAVIFRLLDALRVFDIIYVMTSNSVATISMSGFVRREIVDNNYVGYGSAASTVLFLIIGACTLLYLKLSRVDLGGKK
ncbi:ABC transporter permease [Rhodoferax koreense]|uniref:ABC transporter permease n=1 Tax=Rhodoferax koreensis TaxID=1842727 RepID=A0A1P8JTF9_9BURK|nr:sugar ABC transporter permease [Rhodoferax koreense]APW37037.1 ABC transporter permease [Rhodoferax koreense]